MIVERPRRGDGGAGRRANARVRGAGAPGATRFHPGRRRAGAAEAGAPAAKRPRAGPRQACEAPPSGGSLTG